MTQPCAETELLSALNGFYILTLQVGEYIDVNVGAIGRSARITETNIFHLTPFTITPTIIAAIAVDVIIAI